MKKNGFTLVELLAVIVVLALILVIAIPNITQTSQKIQTNLFCEKVESMEKSAQQWGYDNYDFVDMGSNVTIFSYKDNKNTTFQHARLVTVKELIQKGYQKLDDNKNKVILDPRDDSDLMDKKILVFIKSGRIYASYQHKDANDYESCKEK